MCIYIRIFMFICRNAALRRFVLDIFTNQTRNTHRLVCTPCNHFGRFFSGCFLGGVTDRLSKIR